LKLGCDSISDNGLVTFKNEDEKSEKVYFQYTFNIFHINHLKKQFQKK